MSLLTPEVSYSVLSTGGVAHKLMNHEKFEIFACFSTYGQYLAFTGQYGGNIEVYLMPAGGGVPLHLTYTAMLERVDVSDRMDPNNLVMVCKKTATISYSAHECVHLIRLMGSSMPLLYHGALLKNRPFLAAAFASSHPMIRS